MRTIILHALTCFFLCGQTTAEFEVATVKQAPAQPMGTTSVSMSSDTKTGRLTYSNVTLKEIISKAYKVQKYGISGPGWMDSERFDIVAKFSPGMADDELPPMLQTLLTERFGLTLHRETKEMPVYALTVAKTGLKIKPVEKETGISSRSSRVERHVVASVPMAGLAEYLTGELKERPVVDRTGLPGAYEVTLNWAAEDAPAAAGDDALPSVFTALQEQAGLKLEPARGSVEILVVDRANRVPTDN
jgi:uncharacterized protein (TIGR03435 family)